MTMIMKRGGAGELVSKELEISETPQLLVKADELKNISSLTISITNIYTSAEPWWFSAVNSESTDGDYTNIEWKSGSGSECVYELKITDFSSYTSGIYIAGVSSTVTVKVTAEEGSASQDTPSNTETPSDTDTSSGDGNSGTENGDEDSTGDTEKTITLSFYHWTESNDEKPKYVNIWNHTGIEFADDVQLSDSWEWTHSQGIMTASTEHEHWYEIKLQIKDTSITNEGFDIYKTSSTKENQSKAFDKSGEIYNALVNSTSEILYLYYDNTNSKYATSATYPW